MRTSLDLRSARSLVTLTAVVVGLAASACGVTANTTAATVGDQTISIDQLNAVIGDPAIVGPNDGGASESRQPGGLARAALMYEIQRVAWVEEAERWGVEVTDADRADAEAQLDAQLAQARVELTGATRQGAIDSTAAQNALLARFAEIDPTDESDLRLVHDGAPSRWRSWCLTVVAVVPEDSERVERLLDDGVALEAVPDRVEGAEVIATSEQCYLGSELPVDLEAAVRATTVGERSAPVATTLTGGQALLYFDVERATDPTFDQAREDVITVAAGLRDAVEQLGVLSGLGVDATEEEIQMAQQMQEMAVTALRGWVEDRMRSAEVNPRYGSGIVARSAQLGGGLEVAPPPVPLQPAADIVTMPGDVAVDPVGG